MYWPGKRNPRAEDVEMHKFKSRLPLPYFVDIGKFLLYSFHLVELVVVHDGVSVLGVRRGGAGRRARRAPALTLHPGLAVRVKLGAHAVGAANGKVGFGRGLQMMKESS